MGETNIANQKRYYEDINKYPALKSDFSFYDMTREE
jgi:hypothetical protein